MGRMMMMMMMMMSHDMTFWGNIHADRGKSTSEDDYTYGTVGTALTHWPGMRVLNTV